MINLQNFISLLEREGELKIIDTPLDIDLEIAHLAYLEVKKLNSSKALLFTNPIKKLPDGGTKKFEIPVLCNLFASQKRVSLILQKDSDEISLAIAKLLNIKTPPPPVYDTKTKFPSPIKASFLAKLKNNLEKLKSFASMAFIFPSRRVLDTSNYKIYTGENVDLDILPVLKTWPKDAGAFITMGQVYTKSLDGKMQNIGMYRLQIYNKTQIGLHWQIHKDANHFFHEYKRANKLMPVSIGIGGDPLYTWCGQAPLPCGIYELLLYGFIRGKGAKVSKCLSNDLYLPNDLDIVIEGFCDPNKLLDEGPFGDHTGFYTPIEPYPVLDVQCIRVRKAATFLATVVGKPPLEDKYLGDLTGEVFLPMLKINMPELIDYYMPENGVFHNLILASISSQFPDHSKRSAHCFWGLGQLSFVKHAIFLPPHINLRNEKEVTKFVLNHLTPKNIMFSEGICDALDHASDAYASGGKCAILLSEGNDQCYINGVDGLTLPLRDCISSEELPKLLPSGTKNHNLLFIDTANPILLLSFDKDKSLMKHFVKSNVASMLKKYVGIVILLDDDSNDLDNLYMLVWRVSNNIDALRDIKIIDDLIIIDASHKSAADGYPRIWPDETDCDKSVIDRLTTLGLNPLSQQEMQDFYILKSGKN